MFDTGPTDQLVAFDYVHDRVAHTCVSTRHLFRRTHSPSPLDSQHHLYRPSCGIHREHTMSRECAMVLMYHNTSSWCCMSQLCRHISHHNIPNIGVQTGSQRCEAPRNPSGHRSGKYPNGTHTSLLAGASGMLLHMGHENNAVRRRPSLPTRARSVGWTLTDPMKPRTVWAQVGEEGRADRATSASSRTLCPRRQRSARTARVGEHKSHQMHGTAVSVSRRMSSADARCVCGVCIDPSSPRSGGCSHDVSAAAFARE